MPQKNVKKLVKKEVKKQERKQHGGKRGPKRTFKRKVNARAHEAIRGGGARALAAVESLAVGASVERRAAAELAKRLCVPNMYDSFAVQDGFQTLPVGTASPYMVVPTTFSGTDGTGTDTLGILNSETWAFAFRDVNRCLVYYDAVARTCEYHAVEDNGNSTVTRAANSSLDFDSWDYTSGTAVHGSKLATGVMSEGGRGSGQRWTIGNKLEYIKISGLAASTATTLTVCWLLGDEFYTGTIAATSTAGGVATYNWSSFTKANVSDPDLPNCFHWRLSTLSVVITSGTISFGKSNAICGFRQLTLADFQQLGDFVEEVRISSLNLMFSNTAQALYKGGQMAGRQVPGNLDPFLIASSGFEDFQKPGTIRIGAKNGAHMFYKTTNISDWQFKEVSDPEENGSCFGNYFLDAPNDYLAMTCTMPVNTERGGYWSVFTNCEFKHNNVWVNRQSPNHTKRVFEDALQLLATVPQMHENPFHVKDIFKWIGQHKNQIQQTISMGANAFGGARAKGYADVANDFLDVWFKQ